MNSMEPKSVAIVTGASQGIGKATALRLARDFAAVVPVARDKENLQTAAAETRSAGAETEFLAADLRQPQAADTVVQTAINRFGRIDALLNIAGAVPQIDLFEMTDAQWDDGAALKLHAARRLTMRAWEALKKTNGSVVFMSGSAAFNPKPAFAAVAVINAAINALAKSFAEQGIKDGVQVNSISPGAVMTGRRRAFSKNGRLHTTCLSKRPCRDSRNKPASLDSESRKKSRTSLRTSSHRPRNGSRAQQYELTVARSRACERARFGGGGANACE
jgi:3-oxoacyl-[acyl-carrier protein] reductase